jgi:hypothetical protein
MMGRDDGSFHDRVMMGRDFLFDDDDDNAIVVNASPCIRTWVLATVS